MKKPFDHITDIWGKLDEILNLNQNDNTTNCTDPDTASDHKADNTKSDQK